MISGAVRASAAAGLLILFGFFCSGRHKHYYLASDRNVNYQEETTRRLSLLSWRARKKRRPHE